MALVVSLVVAASAAAQDAKAEQGMKVFDAQKCSICHSVAGKGNKKLPLDGIGAKLSAAQIKEWVTDPVTAAKKANSTTKPPMKAFPNLPPADLDSLVAYVGSLK
jgi:mono/diheme cytochrome c family protein